MPGGMQARASGVSMVAMPTMSIALFRWASRAPTRLLIAPQPMKTTRVRFFMNQCPFAVRARLGRMIIRFWRPRALPAIFAQRILPGIVLAARGKQNMHNALSVANRAYVFETGRIAAEDSAAGLIKNPDLLRAYLGG